MVKGAAAWALCRSEKDRYVYRSAPAQWEAYHEAGNILAVAERYSGRSRDCRRLNPNGCGMFVWRPQMSKVDGHSHIYMWRRAQVYT